MTNWSSDTYNNIEQYAIRGLSQSTPVSQLYYSDKNRDALQIGMKNLVYKQNGTVIGHQSDIELIQVMKSIFNKNANQSAKDILSEVKRLNVMVLNFCVNNIINEIEMYKKYQYDLNNNPIPTYFTENNSIKGRGELSIVYKDPI
jgi:hypothetical protein